jgi:hypothetical protein
MSVVIDGNNGVSGNNGTAATPTLRGDDPDTGIYFPTANVVSVSTGGVQRATFSSSGLSLGGPYLDINGVAPAVYLYNSGGGLALFQLSSDGSGIVQFDALDSTATTGEFRFQVAFAEVARITGSGNLTLSGRLTGYTSSEVTVSREYRGTFAHGLGVVPSRVQMNLRCVSSQFNYAVNDVVYFNGGSYDINSGMGVNISADATNVYLGIYYLYIRNKTTGTTGTAWVEPTYGNWAASVLAWR